jgi:hypothetical protein
MEAQIVVAIFAGGQLEGYHVACKTTHWSRSPSVVADSVGNLHLCWAEGLAPGPSDVYYASTSALVKARLDRVTSHDLVLGLFNTAFGAAAGLAITPIVALWLVPSVVWVAISGRFIGQEGVQGRRGRLALAIGLVMYVLTKALVTPSLFASVPFSAAMPFLPSYLEMPLRVAIPLCTTGAAAGTVIYILRRMKTVSLLLPSLTFMLLDALLTVVSYGPALIAQG